MLLTKETKEKLRPRSSVIFVGLLIALILLFLADIGAVQPHDVDGQEPMLIEIAANSTAKNVAQMLQEKRIIKSSLLFTMWGKLTGQERNIKAGKYMLSPTQTTREILHTLTTGSTMDISIKVTIPEGYTIKQIALLLSNLGLSDEQEFLEIAKNADLHTKYFSESIPTDVEFIWEGFLFPDTYFFNSSVTAKEVAQRMLTRMDEIWEKRIQSGSDMPVKLTPREVITMASLVEREAMLAHERAMVASVFYNRLELNMLLQSCATVQYLFPEAKPVLSTLDTEIPSPYNTYLHPGLPPGPIASPGSASIHAALFPDKIDALYFLATPDGGHVFSNTFDEHLQNQRKYQAH